MTRRQYPHRPCSISHFRVTPVLRGLALLGLLLLPIQMRAGAATVHPHALLHLLLDASDREIDHHHVVPAATDRHGDHRDHPARIERASPDLPTPESIQIAAGGLAVTLVSIVLLLLASSHERIWPRHRPWTSHAERPDFPPPRLVAA